MATTNNDGDTKNMSTFGGSAATKESQIKILLFVIDSTVGFEYLR